MNSANSVHVHVDVLHSGVVKQIEALQDMVADYIELGTKVMVTAEVVHSNPVAGAIQLLVALSEGTPKDSIWARQAKRKLL